MGLLTAEFLVERGAGKVRWSVMRRPRSDMSYNLPVLEGFGKLTLDPGGGLSRKPRGFSEARGATMLG